MHKWMNEAFLRRLRQVEDNFDEVEGLIAERITERNYHTARTSGTVHRVRENAEYAIALLTRGEESDVARAECILTRILELQDQKPASSTFGVWPYLFEEPLDQMLNPDWNWAAFIGKALLQAHSDFSDVLSDKVLTDIRRALSCACQCIMQRKIAVDYTNISLMSAYVTLHAGLLLKNNAAYQYGLERLNRQAEFVERNGSISEYNSPDYGLVDLEEMGRILRYLPQPEIQKPAGIINDALWKMLASHYHQPTKQLAPPHIRCYADVKGARLLTAFEIGTGFQAELLSPEEMVVDLPWPLVEFSCPEQYLHFFTSTDEERSYVDTFYRGYDPIQPDEVRVLLEKGLPSMTATTHFTSRWCMGSFDRQDTWNQRRPFMAYIRNGDGICVLRVRLMHDDMDFASGILETIQEKNQSVCGLHLASDHGDYHYILDPLKNEELTGQELAMMITLDGAVEGISCVQTDDKHFQFNVGETKICVSWLASQGAGGEKPVLIQDGSKVGLKYCLCKGADGRIAYPKTLRAGCAFAISLDEMALAQCEQESDGCAIRLGSRDKYIPWSLVPYAPCPAGEYRSVKNGGFMYHEK